MAEVMNDSPYAMTLPRPYQQVSEGLGYSRHYAQRIRDMGKDSKDSWIKKLWTHMFQGKPRPRNKQGENAYQSHENLSRSRSRLYDPVNRSGRDSSNSRQGAHKRRSREHEPNPTTPVTRRKQKETPLFVRRRDRIKEESSESRDERKSSATTPNLPPINKSHIVSQPSEQKPHQRSAPSAKTKFSQSSTTPLYNENSDDEYETETEEEVGKGENKSSSAQRRSKSRQDKKRASFFDRMAQSSKDDSRATKTVPAEPQSNNAKVERSRTMPEKSATSRNDTKPEVQSKEIVPKPAQDIRSNSNNRARSRDNQPRAQRDHKNSNPNRYERKLRRLHESYDGNRYLKPESRRSHPFFGSHAILAEKAANDSARTKTQRDPQSLEIEKKAKGLADKAMKDNKVFTCEGPYPVDMYVRVSLRKRGWVEKFGNKANNSSASASKSESKANTETEEDYENIIDQSIPQPWEEDNGLYGCASRMVRHFPARFIWGGKSVNSMVLKQEVIVNHFPKARFFSSKTGLTHSLRELMWINSSDSHHFFPRCYTLCPDEQEDIVEDFRVTACVSILKWVLKMYISKKHRDKFQEMLSRRENTKYEEIKFGEDKKEEPVPVLKKSEEPDIKEETQTADEEQDEDGEKEENEGKKEEQLVPPANHSSYKDYLNYEGFDEDYNSEGEEVESDTEKKENEDEKSSEENEETKKSENKKREDKNPKGEPKGYKSRAKSSRMGTRKSNPMSKDTRLAGIPPKLPPSTSRVPPGGTPAKTPRTPRYTSKPFSGFQRSNTVAEMPASNGPVAPDLRKVKKDKAKKVEIPLKAVEWAVYHLDKFARAKEHEDIDSKNKGLTPAQWSQLLRWYYQIAHENASVPNMTEGKLKESDEVLKKMKKIWPQYEIDGKRNIWIVKPGDKSKGVGIEFVAKLEDLMKYVNNNTTAGTYIMQKYIERPLLIHNCKFDIRQWFLVTDWNPLTVWFYKTSYLRICSQQYNLDSLHEAVHLSNVAVQQNYLNGKRDAKLPDNNFMTSDSYVKHLDEEDGKGYMWDKVTYPGMKNAVINVLMATQDIAESRKNAFELYGADFIMTEDFRPWLLEINSSPGMAPSSIEKCKLCSSVIDDLVKVVLDKRESKNADTGNFELAFKASTVEGSKCVDTKFLVEGQRIRRNELAKYNQIDSDETKRKQAAANAPKKENKKIEKPAAPQEKTQEKLVRESKPTPRVAQELIDKEHRFLTQPDSFRPNRPILNEHSDDDDDVTSVESCDEESAPCRPEPKLKPEVEKERALELQLHEKNQGTTSSAQNTPRRSITGGTPGRSSPAKSMLNSARVSSPTRRGGKHRTGSAIFNANNTSHIYGNSGDSHGNKRARYPSSKLNRAQRRSARQNEARMREKHKIYGNVVTSRFFGEI